MVDFRERRDPSPPAEKKSVLAPNCCTLDSLTEQFATPTFDEAPTGQSPAANLTRISRA